MSPEIVHDLCDVAVCAIVCGMYVVLVVVLVRSDKEDVP